MAGKTPVWDGTGPRLIKPTPKPKKARAKKKDAEVVMETPTQESED